MVEHQILHPQLPGQAAGIGHGGVVLFIGMEHICLTVQAEGLVEEPGTAADIGLFAVMVGLIAAAGELFSAA